MIKIYNILIGLKISILLTIALSVFSVTGISQSHKIELSEGNSFYEQTQYNNALSHYDSALNLESNYYPAYYNSGNANYRIAQKSNDSLKADYFDKAVLFYSSALSDAKTKLEKSVAHYNTGNAYLEQKKLKESIESYKDALRNNPMDEDARYNLSYALLKLKAQESSIEDIQKKIDDLQKKIDKENDKQKKKELEKKKEKEQKKKEEKQKEEQEKKEKEADKKKSELDKKQEELKKKQEELNKKKEEVEKEKKKNEQEQKPKSEKQKKEEELKKKQEELKKKQEELNKEKQENEQEKQEAD
ncbi:MAG: tetratricopeptide repeat protein, partial [Flavobacteriales bacterium]